jgi:hypothetical protein
MEEYIELWTCHNGIQLLSNKKFFWATDKKGNECKFPVEVQKEFVEKFTDNYHINPKGVKEICDYTNVR